MNKLLLPAALILWFLAFSLPVTAQGVDSELRSRAKALFDAQNFTEALPLYEQLSKQAPDDPEIQRNLGFSLIGQAMNTPDDSSRRQLRIRARNAFLMCRELGDKSLLVQGLIEGLPADGRDGAGFSDNAEANKLMQKAEGLFASGKLDEAIKVYGEALAIDPRCYHAALFTGDAHMKSGRLDEAEKWYQRAISINPDIETGHRYSATPLMRSGKFDQARDRYVEAFIVAPYDRLALSGLVQWGQITKTQLGHPQLNIPKTTTGPDGKQNTTINVNPLADDGSMSWIAYSATREAWKTGKFAKTFPAERDYRHSLAEEADALRSVVTMAKTLKTKTLNPQIAMIEQMDKDGVLEAFILMAIPDQGIAQDHRAYLRSNRQKLRTYVLKYVIASGR